MCEICMCLAPGGLSGEEVSEGEALLILWEQGKCWTCACVWVAVVWVVYRNYSCISRIHV